MLNFKIAHRNIFLHFKYIISVNKNDKFRHKRENNRRNYIFK